MNRVGVHTVVGDLPDLGAVVGRGDRGQADARGQADRLDHLGCRVDKRIEYQVLLRTGLDIGRLQTEVAAHAAVFLLKGLAHLVLDGLANEGDGQAERLPGTILGQGVEIEDLVEDLHKAGAWPVGLEIRAIGRVVRALTDDDRVLGGLEHASTA